MNRHQKILKLLKRPTSTKGVGMYGYPWIYAVQMQIPNVEAALPVKIGISVDLCARMRSIQTGQPYPLKLVTFFPALRGFETESLIHELFAEVRLSGEWFLPDPVVLAFLAEQDANFKESLEMNRVPIRRAKNAQWQVESLASLQSNREAWRGFAERGMTVMQIMVSDPPAEIVEPDAIKPPIDWRQAINDWLQDGLAMPSDVAAILDIEESELKNLVFCREIPHYAYPGKRLRWSADQIIESVLILDCDPSALKLPS